MLRHWMGRSLAAAWNTRRSRTIQMLSCNCPMQEMFFCVIVQRRWFLDRKFIFLLEQAHGLLRSGHHMRSAILNLPFALGFELLNREVTFTGGMFQILAVQDSYRSAPILDKAGLLQNPSRNANARSPCSQHARHKFVRKGQQRGTAEPTLSWLISNQRARRRSIS